MLVDGFDVIPLPGRTRDDRRLPRRGRRDDHRDRVAEIVLARFAH